MGSEDRIRDLEEQSHLHSAGIESLKMSMDRVVSAVNTHDSNNAAAMTRVTESICSMESRIDKLDRKWARVEGAGILARWAAPVLVALAGAAAGFSSFIRRGQ